MKREKTSSSYRLPETYLTRGLLRPNQLTPVVESLERGLGRAAILFDPTTMQIPLFKLSALPSVGRLQSIDQFNEVQAAVDRHVRQVEPEVDVPVYRNSQPTLFVVDGKDLALRLRNSYPKTAHKGDHLETDGNHQHIEEPETLGDSYEGGHIDYIVHLGVQTVRKLFPDDPVGPDHRGYINGRDRRMRRDEIFDYIKIGELVDDSGIDPFTWRHITQNPEEFLISQGHEIIYPQAVTFGAMRVQVRERAQRRDRLTVAI